MNNPETRKMRRQEDFPVSVQLVDLPEVHAERCRRLARERGWAFLGPEDTSPPDVLITPQGGTRRDESKEGSKEGSGKRGPRTPQVWLVDDGVELAPPKSPDLIQYLPMKADDTIWVALIENAVHMGRLLTRFYERIHHLQQVSTTDALTGLYNRMHLLRVLSNEYKRYQRTGAPLSCIMIDLDHFKNINDTYGHSFGDQILSAFAQVLSDTVRESDIIGRYGGEEFLCILPNTNIDGACAAAEKLRRVIEARVFTEGFFNIEITSSFGVSSTSPEVKTEGGLIQIADRALYRAKQTGRNRVCVVDGARPQAATGERGDAGSGDAGRGDRPTVLIAHAHPDELLFYKALQANQQFDVAVVENSDDALKWLATHTPAAALIKANLQPLNGWDLIERVRSKTADNYFPIAILESETGSSVSLSESRTGADDVFSEAIGEDEFGRRIRVFLRLKLLHDRFNETYERLTGARARLVKAERLSALGQMASGVAHDFNNVLSTILGRTERLLRTYSEEKIGEELRAVHKAAADGAKSVRRIQEFSRTISDMDSSPQSVAETIADCIDLTRVRWKDEAEKNGFRIRILNQVDASLVTSANPTELREVFVKLFVNAFDAMPKGGEIILRSFQPEGDERFLIEMEDTGTGMDAAVQKRIFEPFFSTKSGGGTGLGLSIVYGIVTRIGGMIEAESEPGRGTTFRIWFPRSVVREEPEARRSIAPMPVELEVHPKGPDLKVLVVEDEASVRDLFVDVLVEEGYAVDQAECARDAMALMKRRTYDAVLTDLGMPDLPGWDVARFAKEQCPQTCVLLTSGWGDDYSDEFLKSRGVDHWLPKPVSLDELFSILRKVAPVSAKDSKDMA
jgi:diguanylate cyclase (GGDEF)-like protein